jgi:drug/metabolite transporter (DMT)-like permease
MSNNKLAIFLIITSVFFGTVMLSFLKIAQEDVNVYVAGFFRFFLGLVIILPYIVKNKDAVLKTTHLKQHFLRAILGLPAMLIYFSALVLLPIEKLTCDIFCSSFNCNNSCGIFFRRKNLYL